MGSPVFPRRWLSVGLVILFAAIPIGPAAGALREGKPRRPAPPVEIASAMYGKGDKRVDVTRELRRLVKDGRLQIAAPWNFGVLDPKAGDTEDLIVQYRVGDQTRIARFRKNQAIELPAE